jgi:hypothetical protein
MATTTRPMIRIHDLSDDSITDREMNDEEFAAYEAQQTANAAVAQAEADKATAKAALLTKLGITADEAKLLLS